MIFWASPISIRQEIGNVPVPDPFDIVLPDIIHAHDEFGVMYRVVRPQKRASVA